MPTTVNGVGSHYYGKRDIVTRFDACDSCGVEGKLTSYETTLFFVILYIPIIPMGKKRIVDSCPNCTRHKIIPLKQWNEIREDVLERSLDEYRENPSHEGATINLIAGLRAVQLPDRFSELEPEFRKHHSGNIDVLLSIAYAWNYFSAATKAEKTFNEVLRLDSDNKIAKENLGLLAMRRGDLKEARRSVEHIIRRGEPDKAWIIYQMAEACQAAGDHRQALEMFDRWAELKPDLVDDKFYKKDRKVSEKNLETGKIIKNKKRNVFEATASAESGSSGPGWIAAVIGPVLLLLIIAGWIYGSWHIGQNREVFLLNGLDKPYAVTFNGGSPINLAAGDVHMITMAEGDILIEVISDDFEIDPETVAFRTGFIGRIFNNDIHIINPDAAGIIQVERVWYGDNISSLPDPSSQIITGRPLHSVSHIDYVLSDLPDQIKTDSSKVQKSRLDMYSIADYNNKPDLQYYMNNSSVSSGVKNSVRKFLSYSPDHEIMLNLMYTRCEPVEFLKFAKPYLENRPPLVEYHRLYQSTMVNEGNGDEVRLMYQEMLEGETDGDMYYLAGRIMDFQKDEVPLFLKGLELDPDNINLIGSLGYSYTANGDLETAGQYYQKLRDLSPETYRHYSNMQNYALMANDQELGIHATERMLEIEPAAVGTESWLSYFYHLQGDDQQSQQVQNRVKQKFRMKYSEETGDYYQSVMEERNLIGRGDDIAVYEQLIENEEVDGLFRIHAAVALGKIPQLETFLEEFYDYTSINEYALGIVAIHQSEVPDRDQKCQEMIEMLKTDFGHLNHVMMFLEVLEGQSTHSPGRIITLTAENNLKLPMLLLLGEFDETNRSIYWSMARKINRNPFSGKLAYEKLMSPPQRLATGG